MDTVEYVNIPEILYKLHKLVKLTADVMFVNGNKFMMMSERKLNFVTADHIPSQTEEHIIKSLNKVIKLYGSGGLIIHIILMDMEFQKVKDRLKKL